MVPCIVNIWLLVFIVLFVYNPIEKFGLFDNIFNAQAQAAQLANPDDVAQEEEAPVEELIVAKDAQTAAWHSFVQALIGSAEFRYVR